MTKARTLADFVSSGNPLADGTISVSEVVGAAPLANPTFTGDLTAPEIDLTAIAKDISDTAVDVFVYDTSKDSDGGAWRKRTQATSWYNEALNTATRGSRKEFPAVAVIVAESNQVTIYDGDDPDLPMWMVFNAGGGSFSDHTYIADSSAVDSLGFINAQMVVGNSSGYGIFIIDFLKETSECLRASDEAGLRGIHTNVGIANRNTNSGEHLGTLRQLISNSVNDIAMTVLPNAPLDAATGLPVPTIAVATSANVSIIRDNGTVVDITYANYNDARNIYFNSKNHLIYSHYNGATQSAAKVYYEIPSSDLANAQGGYQRGAETVYYAKSGISPDINLGDALHISDISENSFGTSEKLILTDETTPPTSSMINFIASDHQTGWMNGDIKLATLSDTDDTNVTGAELVTNGTFASNTTGWTDYTSIYMTVSHASGAARLTHASNWSGWYGIGQDITTVVGQTYVASYDVTESDSGNMQGSHFYLGDSTILWGVSGTYEKSGTITGTFVATSTTTNIRTGHGGVGVGSGDYYTIDNFTVRLAEEDRSVNGNGLQVFGTVTKTAVATGADLMGYSGFSASNYLEQPYNSDLDFGTGDFCIMGWMTRSYNSYRCLATLWNAAGTSGFRLQAGGNTTGIGFDPVSGSSVYISGLDATKFSLVCFVRRSGVIYGYVNGKLQNSAANTTNISTLDGSLIIGHLANEPDVAWQGKVALLRMSATAPSAEQIKKMYNDEKFLFQENAKATLYGTSDAVTALAYDDDTELLHAGTSAGRSVFQGLRRIDNTTDAVGAAISASNGMVAED